MLLLVTVKDKIRTYTLISVSWPIGQTIKQQHTAHPLTSSTAKNSHYLLTFNMTEESDNLLRCKNFRKGSKLLTPPSLTIGSRLNKEPLKVNTYKSRIMLVLLSKKETRSIVTWDNWSSLTPARCGASGMDLTSLSRHSTRVLIFSKLLITLLDVCAHQFMVQTFSWHTCLLLRFNPSFLFHLYFFYSYQLVMFIEDD